MFDKIKNLDEKNRIIIRNTVESLVVKGFSIVVSFLTTPLFIHYFNDNKVLGIWYTLLSVLIWFLNFDLGLGNGIRNNLVKDLTRKDYLSARKTISSGMFSVGVVTIILTLIGSILISCINLNSFFNIDGAYLAHETILWSTIFIFVAIMLRFFLTTISSVFYALQRSAVNNMLALCVSVLQLLYVLLVRFDNVEDALINISFAYIFLSNLPVMIAGYWVFHKELKNCKPSINCIEKESITAIVHIGALFFLCQILYMIIANTNEFFITNLYGGNYTAEYTFYYKLTSLASMIVTLGLAPIWSVVTKAQQEGNFLWLSKLFNKIKLAGLGVLVLQLVFIPLLPYLMNLWLGKGIVDVQYDTALSFALFGSAFVYSGMLSTISNGLAMMKVQTIAFSIGVALKIILIYALYTYTSWDFVVWCNFIILLPYIISQQISLNRYLRKKILLA